jgi:hypothetical protein
MEVEMKKKKIFIGMSILYLVSGFINLVMGFISPEVYKVWSDSAIIPIYKSMMNSFTLSTLTIIMCVVFLYQIIMSYCFFHGKGRTIIVGLLMSILFHLVIIPWGLWSLPNIGFVILSFALLHKILKHPMEFMN